MPSIRGTFLYNRTRGFEVAEKDQQWHALLGCGDEMADLPNQALPA